MSVVVGIETDEGVWLASDSCFSTDDEASAMEQGKIFQTGNGIGVGVVGRIHPGQLIQYYLEDEVPEPPDEEDTMKWLVTRLVPALKHLMDTHDIWEWEKKSERGLCLLLCVAGKLYGLTEDWSVWRPVDRYAAIGTGSSVALGSLYSTEDYEAEDRVTMAVLAAAHHVPSVSEPVDPLFIEKK